jgi:hypothetical protein
MEEEVGSRFQLASLDKQYTFATKKIMSDPKVSTN